MDVKTAWCVYWDGVRERGKFLKFFYAGEAQFLVEINIHVFLGMPYFSVRLHIDIQVSLLDSRKGEKVGLLQL